MCLVRLLNFLKLYKITQVSFAEYYSKRKFVERVHALENQVLSAHGPFKGQSLHKNPRVGSAKHKENMEAMVDEIQQCIERASFGGKPIICRRGLKADEFVFSDEDQLKNFLSLNEEQKMLNCEGYKAKQCWLLQYLHLFWEVDMDFQGSYISDYDLLQNGTSQASGQTAWIDKYTTTLFSKTTMPIPRFNPQPLPDYVRWVKTCEFHYMTSEEASLLEEGPWHDIPGLFIPSRILDICYTIFPQSSKELKKLLSILAWTVPKEVEKFYEQCSQQVQRLLEEDERLEMWKNHCLYKCNSEEELQKN